MTDSQRAELQLIVETEKLQDRYGNAMRLAKAAYNLAVRKCAETASTMYDPNPTQVTHEKMPFRVVDKYSIIRNLID